MAEHIITISNRIATANAGIELICNNPTDTIRFIFDDEWSGNDIKTARFSWEGKHIDVPFSGNTVQLPEIFLTNYVFVGVFSNTITSTPVKLKCRYSIKCMGGKVIAPSDDVYARIITLIEELSEKGATDAQLASAVEKYLQENPVEAGATTEQANQIEQNTQDIAELKQSGGIAGDDGATFIPSVSASGVLSWTNDKGLSNPDPVNIKGEKGEQGKQGVQGIQGNPGNQGIQGEPGTDGVDGTGIESIAKTATSGLVDTYTIALTDGTSYTFTVTNGQNGSGSSDGGTIYMQSSGGYIQYSSDGVSWENIIALSELQGEAGVDGVSCTHSWDGTVLTITSASGTSSTDLKGEKGADGEPGVNGTDGIDGISVSSASINESDHLILTLSNGSTVDAGYCRGEQGIQGEQGEKGTNGVDGYTPVRGTDYWTAADIAEIQGYVDDAILGGEW